MRKIKMFTILISICFLLTGCGLKTIIADNVKENTGDIQFVPISYQHINDGTNGLDIIKYVDLSSGVVYLYTEKYNNGYATTCTPLLNVDGTPCVYENLEQLRMQHNYN